MKKRDKIRLCGLRAIRGEPGITYTELKSGREMSEYLKTFN